MENGEIGVIDFNRWEVGDPYEEFYKLESFARELSVPYCIGQIQAYFNDEVPGDFWSILAVYVAHASLFSVKWAEKFRAIRHRWRLKDARWHLKIMTILKEIYRCGMKKKSFLT